MNTAGEAAADTLMQLSDMLSGPMREMVSGMPDTLDLTIVVTSKNSKGCILMSTGPEFNKLEKFVEELKKNIIPPEEGVRITREMNL